MGILCTHPAVSETGQSVIQASLRDDCLEVGTHSVTTQIPRKRLTRAGYEGHPFGRMEARRATKINVNFPTLAQPKPHGWGTRRKKRQNQRLPHLPDFPGLVLILSA